MDGKFDRYGSGASSRAFYLTAFNGGPYLKDRVGKGTRDDEAEIRVENLALNILGGIQPDRLSRLRDLTSDGLLQRFLVVLMAARVARQPKASGQCRGGGIRKTYRIGPCGSGEHVFFRC